MSTYDVLSIIKTTFNVAIPANNNRTRFVVTGTWPVTTDIFGENDFLFSQVTDRVYNNVTKTLVDVVEAKINMTTYQPQNLKIPITTFGSHQIKII